MISDFQLLSLHSSVDISRESPWPSWGYEMLARRKTMQGCEAEKGGRNFQAILLSHKSPGLASRELEVISVAVTGCHVRSEVSEWTVAEAKVYNCLSQKRSHGFQQYNYITLHSENIARTRKLLRNYFPRDCAKLSQAIARNNSWGIVSGAIAQFCCCSLLSYCSCSMLPKIDLHNGHFVIAANYFWRIISGWIARNSRNQCAK